MAVGAGVSNFLLNLGMENYAYIFKAKGFDEESDILHLTRKDLQESLGITSERDIEVILKHAKHHVMSKEHSLKEWLCSNFLEHYYDSFVLSELTDLSNISTLQLPNDDLYDELEMVLPGHRKRLERAVTKLQQQLCQNTTESPVTQGWWGRPSCLPQAKFDFLCVRAQLFNPLEEANKVDIDFMVDSGSDVCTVQESSVANLNLRLLGSVYSCGIHGGNHANLYMARLQIGNQFMDIEVLVSNYDSIGSRVVRNFRHIISSDRHIWLKGNYKDPLPAFLPLPPALKPTLPDFLNSQKQIKDATNSSVTNVTDKYPNPEGLICSENHPDSNQNKMGPIEHPAIVGSETSSLPSTSNNVKHLPFDNTDNCQSTHSSHFDSETKSMTSDKKCYLENTHDPQSMLNSQESVRNGETSVSSRESDNSDEKETSTTKRKLNCNDERAAVPLKLSKILSQNLLEKMDSSDENSIVELSTSNQEPTKSEKLLLTHIRDTDDDIDHMGQSAVLKQGGQINDLFGNSKETREEEDSDIVHITFDDDEECDKLEGD